MASEKVVVGWLAKKLPGLLEKPALWYS